MWSAGCTPANDTHTLVDMHCGMTRWQRNKQFTHVELLLRMKILQPRVIAAALALTFAFLLVYEVNDLPLKTMAKWL